MVINNKKFNKKVINNKNSKFLKQKKDIIKKLILIKYSIRHKNVKSK